MYLTQNPSQTAIIAPLNAARTKIASPIHSLYSCSLLLVEITRSAESCFLTFILRMRCLNSATIKAITISIQPATYLYHLHFIRLMRTDE